MTQSVLSFICIVALTFRAFGQTPADSLIPSAPLPSSPVKIKPLDKLSVGGYFRFYGWGRQMQNTFPIIPDNPSAQASAHVLTVGDVYRDPPMMLLNVGVNPGGNTHIGMSYALYSNFTGIPGNSPINLNLGINLIGSMTTKHGTFVAQAGGINWVDVSDMLFSGFIGYDRFSIFERFPWEEIIQQYDRGATFYTHGTLSRETRFGMQPFKGFMLDGYDLPYGFSFRLLYGQTPATSLYGSRIPRYTTGGRLRKTIGKQELSFNTMHYMNYLDSLGAGRAGIDLYTLSMNGKFGQFTYAMEGGMGQLFSSPAMTQQGGAIRARLRSMSGLTGIPIEVEGFYLSPNFVNYYGNFLSFNTNLISSEATAQTSAASNGGVTNFSGSIGDVGQLSNNRQGFTVNTWFSFGRTRVSVGNMVSSEIDKLSNQLSFGHKINALPFSRFSPFTDNIGPYRRWNSYFRGYSEQISITDTVSGGLPAKKAHFNMLQVQVKQPFTIFDVGGYLFYVGSFGTAQTTYSLVPLFNKGSYLRSVYHEFDAILRANDLLSFSINYGLERIKGNRQTTLGDNNTGRLGDAANDPVNQRSSSIGLGLDLMVSKGTGLYVRHRFFSARDFSFINDHLDGHETTVELKVFF